jgi:hypothetical protein
VFSIGLICVGVLLVGATVGNVSLWLFTNSSSYTDYRKKMAHISEEMSYYHLPPLLQYRIRKYYDYLWIHQKRGGISYLFEDEELSEALKTDISLYLAREHFKIHKIPIFAITSLDFQIRVVKYFFAHQLFYYWCKKELKPLFYDWCKKIGQVLAHQRVPSRRFRRAPRVNYRSLLTLAP